ncbi:glycosyltransferase [Collinsella sp. An7]|uniref:glycosyltransferase family 2 protein n=1 Tax=Collinsella sp. An7 TaxID=1965651 RepID=UPI000B38F69B|nr:glycosyltransferase family 2 protein [Collinsella sp. An7]OUN46452.1 glycosyltransferase [Collinsella sp. An7]
MADSLYIVMPAYNEAANIHETLEQWYPVVERVGGSSALVVFDDGSKDDTYRLMCEFAKTHPRFLPQTKANSGHGATLIEAYRFALKSGADFVFQTDSDGQTNPNEFWKFWAARNDYDMVIGWRRGREDGFSRVIVTKTLKLVVRILFGVSVTDANTPFRLMTAQSLRENLSFVPDDFNLTNVVLSVVYAKRREPVKYLPVTFRPRQGGVNSINLKSIFGIGRRALRDFRQLNREIDWRLAAGER